MMEAAARGNELGYRRLLVRRFYKFDQRTRYIVRHESHPHLLQRVMNDLPVPGRAEGGCKIFYAPRDGANCEADVVELSTLQKRRARLRHFRCRFVSRCHDLP